MRIILISKKRLKWYITVIVLIIIGLIVLSRIGEKSVPTINPIYIGDTKEKAVSLMFNVDWGEDLISDLLDILKQENVKATFFISGRFAKKFPEITKSIFTAGHEIGNHGYSHPHSDNISMYENKKEIVDTENVFSGLGIKSSKLFAPPYGEHANVTVEAADSLGFKTILWTLDTVDWKDPSPETILNRILPKADNGSMILMHPKKCTLQALPSLIKSLKKEGFGFKTVTEIIRQ